MNTFICAVKYGLRKKDPAFKTVISCVTKTATSDFIEKKCQKYSDYVYLSVSACTFKFNTNKKKSHNLIAHQNKHEI